MHALLARQMQTLSPLIQERVLRMTSSCWTHVWNGLERRLSSRLRNWPSHHRLRGVAENVLRYWKFSASEVMRQCDWGEHLNSEQSLLGMKCSRVIIVPSRRRSIDRGRLISADPHQFITVLSPVQWPWKESTSIAKCAKLRDTRVSGTRRSRRSEGHESVDLMSS